MQKNNCRGETAMEQNSLSVLCRGVTQHDTSSLARVLAEFMQLYLQQRLSGGHLCGLDLQL